jgi:hypothetical protein
MRVLWQGLQTILGMIIVKISKAVISHRIEDVSVYRTDRLIGGMSLGQVILLGQAIGPHSEAHEYGHCRQSRILGPFYLLVVGVPSLISRMFPSDTWYRRWPESWADRLGGVERE